MTVAVTNHEIAEGFYSTSTEKTKRGFQIAATASLSANHPAVKRTRAVKFSHVWVEGLLMPFQLRPVTSISASSVSFMCWKSSVTLQQRGTSLTRNPAKLPQRLDVTGLAAAGRPARRPSCFLARRRSDKDSQRELTGRWRSDNPGSGPRQTSTCLLPLRL